ncbi:MAG: RNA polymerase sigma factor [Planctomycetota bacterium]|jgi:RNA polymerase sigma-70 factor (ECF subfamily)
MAESPTRAEFQEIFRAHRERVFRLLWRLTGDPHGAEDLLQETFIRFWRKRDQYRGEGSLAGYLCRIAYRTWLNARARMAAKRPPMSLDRVPEGSDPGPDESVEEEDARSFLVGKVREALETLPEGAREAFLLFRFEDMTVAQVAEVTGTPVKTVESRLKRATEVLAARLRRYGDQFSSR